MTDIVVPSAGGSTTIPFDSLFTSTMANYNVEQLAKNYLESRPLLKALMDNFERRDSSGGIYMQGSAAYGTNTAVRFFTGADPFSQEVSQTALPLVYRWRYIGCPVSFTRTELAENRSTAKIFDLMESRVKQAMYTMRMILNQEAFSDGTNYSGNTIVGIAAGVSSTPSSDPASGPVGGLSASTNSWWRNNAVTSFGSFAANGPNGTAGDTWTHTWNLATDGDETPTHIITDQLTWEYYRLSLMKIARYIDPSAKSPQGDLGWNSLEYQGKSVQWDRMCPSGTAYFLNTRYQHFYVDPSMLFEWSPVLQMPYQLAASKIVACRLAMTYWSRMYSATISGITA